MIKKDNFILLAILMLITLMGCALYDENIITEQETFTERGTFVEQKSNLKTREKMIDFTLSDKDFIIKNDNTFIKLGDDYENLKTNENILKRYSDEDHYHKTYVYEDFVIGINLEADVSNVTWHNYDFETVRGVRVGDNISEVFKKYGSDYKCTVFEYSADIMKYYSYDFDDNVYYKYLMFYVDQDENITDIRFYMP